MADFFDTTSWNEKPWFQTGGTRSKVILENPANQKVYYFKTSLKKVKLDYKYEFWSEIVASEVGSLLGFDMLKYDIAFNRTEMGCISMSMVTEGQNKLAEGISYLTGYDTTYNPEKSESKQKYTFQLICKSLEFFNLQKYIRNIIEIIILDSIIGNGDRHQENWGIITEYNDIVKTLEEFGEKGIKGFWNKSFFALFGVTSKEKRVKMEESIKKVSLFMPGKFSQIYDSGSCLGRELKDVKINKMLKDQLMLDAYINRGVSEIHWKGKKLNHFDLIEKINKQYPDIVKEVINQTTLNYSETKISNCIQGIDKALPADYIKFKLPDNRKNLMIKLIVLRMKKLREII